MATPTLRITADGRDVTALFLDRNLSLQLQDESGTDNDTLDLELDDRDWATPLPPVGIDIGIALGFAPQQPVDMGFWTVDEVSVSGPPDRISVRCKSSARGGDGSRKTQRMHSSRSDSWSGINLQSVAARIARRNGLQLRLHPDLRGVTVTPDQIKESDAHFLTRLGVELNLTVKWQSGYLIILPVSTPGQNDGGEYPIITRADCNNYRATVVTRGDFSRVVASYHDPDSGRDQIVVAGSGDGAALRLNRNYATLGQAKAAGQAKLRQMAVEKLELELSLALGRPEIYAEGFVRLQGFRPPINGQSRTYRSWTNLLGREFRADVFEIVSVTHSYDGNGLSSNLRCRLTDKLPNETSGVSRETTESRAPAPESTAPSSGASQDALNCDSITIGSPYRCEFAPGITYGDFTLGQEARRFTSRHQLETARLLAEFLSRVQERFGRVIITSGHRPEPINSQQDGARTSEHLYDRPDKGAVDFTIAGFGTLEMQMVFRWVRQNWDYSVGDRTWDPNANFIHLGVRPSRPQVDWDYRS